MCICVCMSVSKIKWKQQTEFKYFGRRRTQWPAYGSQYSLSEFESGNTAGWTKWKIIRFTQLGWFFVSFHFHCWFFFAFAAIEDLFWFWISVLDVVALVTKLAFSPQLPAGQVCLSCFAYTCCFFLLIRYSYYYVVFAMLSFVLFYTLESIY